MKISKLLVLTALWLGLSSNATAAVSEGVWTMPDPSSQLEFTTFTADGQRYVLFNPATKMFFASGNGWNTMASLRTFGMEIWLADATEADAPEGSYELFCNNVNNPARNTGEHNMFTDDGNATWVDHGTQGNYSWAYEIVDGMVRFQNVALIADKPAFTGMYLGFDGTYVVADNTAGDSNHRDAFTAILRHVDPSAAGASVDFKAVTYASYEQFTYSDEYETYQEGAKQYIAAMGLKQAIQDAAALTIDVTAAEATYNNSASSADELVKATSDLTEIISQKQSLKKLVEAGAEVNAPIEDAQALLANASATAAELKAALDKLNPIVEARKSLKKALDDAKAAGFDATADYDAVYNDKASTEAQLKKALEDLSAAVVEWGKGHATWDKPSDMTGKIVNPNFDNASYSGWSGTAPNMVGSGSHGPANVAEKWNDTFDTYQEIIGLPAGVYALSAQTMWRGSWNDMQKNIGPAAFLYATAGGIESKVPFNYAYGPLNTESMAGDTPWGVGAGEQSYTDEEAGITYYIPNDPSCFRLYAEKGLYDTKVLFVVNEGDTLRIGVKNPAKLGDADNWTCFDTFKLTFYGNGADACQNYVNEAMKNFGEYEIEEGTLYTAAYLTAYEQAYKGEKTATSMAEVEAVVGGVNKAKADLDNNIKLWKDYVKICEKADKMRVDPEYMNMESYDWYDLCDYIDEDYETIIENVALTNEQLEAEIAKVNGWITTVDEQSKQEVYDGKVMTKYIKNAGFDDDEDINYGGAEGWTIDRISGGNVVRGPLGQGNQDIMVNALGEQNFCFESWHCHKWDIWQEIKNLPKGMYELQVQGYVRCEVGGYTQGDELGDQFPSPVYLYMNNAMSSFPSVYSEMIDDSHYVDGALPVVESHSWNGAVPNYPNSMGAASLCFKWGMYKTTAFGLIAKEGDTFRIGVKMDKDQDWWCIFDNFKLIYRTPTAELVKPLLEEELAKINLEQPMGKNVFAQAAQVKKDAADAIAASDGQKMFDALSAAYDLSASIIASSSLFNDLAKANESFYESLSNYTEASAAALADAGTLYTTISDGIENHEYEDAEVEGLLNQIKAMRTKLAFPEGWENATDAKPAECTMAIQSNSFFDEFNYVNTAEGWKNAGNLGNDDEQKGAQAIEFWQIAFDMSQDIIGLPEGTYIVQADAWCRIGGNDENYTAWQANPAATMAFLYAVDGDSVVYSTPVANIMKAGDALFDATGYQGEAEFTVEDNTYWLPGSLVSGKGIMEVNEGVYTNKVVAKVKADGKLTVGIKKDQEKTNSWVVCDDFKLFYCGKESSLTPDGDASGIDTINETVQVKIEYFTLDGRKATRAQKGIMIQKMTLGNGATIVRKIQK